jgi:heme-degrading monooxygenase HmoA
MLVVLFRSRLSDLAGEDFDEMSERMLEIATSIPGSGFVEMRTYESVDGERMAVVWWRDKESLDRWRTDPRHREAQRLGRERWYTFYDIEVAEIIRGNRFP